MRRTLDLWEGKQHGSDGRFEGISKEGIGGSIGVRERCGVSLSLIGKIFKICGAREEWLS